MAEYWKSTVSGNSLHSNLIKLIPVQPKYWCKYCEVYVKDTKFERAQHEATGRHQGNIQRSLKSLHRKQENEQRDKARAQAEVARLNGLVGSTSTPSVATGSGGTPTYEKRSEKKATIEDRKRQWEQLAAMGIALPEAARGDMAIAGEWKTVSEKVVGEVNEDGEFKAVSLNKGVRKRKMDEEEIEDMEAREVITKKKGWGNTYKAFPGSVDAADEIENLFRKQTQQQESREKSKDPSENDDGVKAEAEDDSEARPLADIPTAEEAQTKASQVSIKQEEGSSAAPGVVFKKRKKLMK